MHGKFLAVTVTATCVQSMAQLECHCCGSRGIPVAVTVYMFVVVQRIVVCMRVSWHIYAALLMIPTGFKRVSRMDVCI